MSTAMRDCRYCAETHGTALLCESARRVLDALCERGQRFDLAPVEFPESIEGAAGLLGDGTVLCRQLTVMAAMVEVSGIPQPMIVLSGSDANGGQLPQWAYPGSADEMGRFLNLVTEMTGMAIRAAVKARKAL